MGLQPQDAIAHIVGLSADDDDDPFEVAVNEALSRRTAEHAGAGKETADGHHV